MGWVPDAQRSVLDQLLTLLLRDTAVGKHNITARLRHQQSPTPISSLSATDTKEIEASMKKWRQHEQKWQHQQHPQHPQHQQYQQHKQQSSPAVRHWRQQHSSSAAINGTSSATRLQYACVLHGNSKHPTQTRTERQPRIAELTNELYLFTFILTGDGLMLRHWLQHYHRLGVRPNQTSLAIRLERGETASDAAEILSVLAAKGVPHANVRMISEAPSDHLKVATINKAIDLLPPKSYFIYADVDEHFDYPCQRPRESIPGCMLGVMIDQLAGNGNISRARETPTLEQQYPLQCRIRSRLNVRSNYLKTIIFNIGGNGMKPRRFRSTHLVGNESRCPLFGIVRHYSMTGQQYENNAARTVPAIANKPTGFRDGQPVYGVSVNYANATCGMTDPSTGACLDYDVIGKFMKRQIDQVAAKGSSVPWELCGAALNLTHLMNMNASFESPPPMPPAPPKSNCCVGQDPKTHKRWCNLLKRVDCSSLKTLGDCHNSRVAPSPCVWARNTCMRGLPFNESLPSWMKGKPQCPHAPPPRADQPNGLTGHTMTSGKPGKQKPSVRGNGR